MDQKQGKNATLEQYQEFCAKGWKKGCCREVFLLGLGGEAGEVMEIVKKSIRDDKPIDIPHLKEELGDVMWYVANICTIFGLDLQEIVDENIDKLSARYKDLIKE